MLEFKGEENSGVTPDIPQYENETMVTASLKALSFIISGQ